MTETISAWRRQPGGRPDRRDAYAKAADFLPLKGIDHVEFWVGNARQAAAYYRALWGFTPVAFSGLETKVRDRASYVMVQHDIRFVFTAPLTPDGEIAEHVREHGDGVHDIAFAVDDVESAWRETTSRGAVSALGADRARRRRGRHRCARSSIHTYGEVLHSFVDRRDYHGAFAPGYPQGQVDRRRPPTGLSLLEVDHCVGNVGLGEMDTFVDFYRDVLGFAQLIHYDDKVIHTDYSALMSKVMTNGNGRIKFPINEPATGKKKSQIQEYLDWYRSPGCQHIALRTEDIVGTVRRLRDNGVEFLGPAARVLRDAGRPRRRRRRPDRHARGARHRGRPRRGGLPPPDLHPARPGPPDVLLRDHRAPRLARLRRRQLQGAVRGHRARTGEAREPLGEAPALLSRPHSGRGARRRQDEGPATMPWSGALMLVEQHLGFGCPCAGRPSSR